MDFNKISIPSEMENTLDELYQRFKKLHPRMTESNFIETIFKQWLKPYDNKQKKIYKKSEVNLRNNVKQAIKLSGKTQKQIAQEIGVNRTYLGQIIRGEYEPSVTMALLIIKASGYPIEKLEEVFYLEPVEE